MVAPVRRYGSALLLVLTGAAILRISLFSALYLRYVQPALRPYLVVSGVVLVVLGLLAAVVRRKSYDDEDFAYDDDARARDEDGSGHGHGHDEHEHEDEDEDEHGHSHHGHGHGPRVAWLLTLPALALLLFPPPALGSYSAGREAAQRASRVSEPSRRFRPAIRSTSRSRSSAPGRSTTAGGP